MPFDLSELPDKLRGSRSSSTAAEDPASPQDAVSPQDVLSWALERFGDRIVVASSFGVEDVALIDMAAAIRPDVRVFMLDTGRLHQATYDVMDRIRNRYQLRIEVMFPDAPRVEAMVREHGINLFYDSPESRRRCCLARKVEPLKRMLTTVDAWVTGLRRDQGVTRGQVAHVELDHANNSIVKVNPLADWTSEQVWDYVKANRVPYNALHDGGFPSIGCEPCTRPVKPGEDARSGRWWWENPDTRECGLHLKV